MNSRLLFVALVCVTALLLHPVHALTYEEMGTVSTVNGVPCRFCFLDCEASPLLKNCKTRYFQYGCHINQYCFTVNTATSREFFAALAICVYRNGCELVSSNERVLLNATAEGRLDLQMQDYVASQISSLSTDVNMYKLQGEVYNAYYNQISSIEANWISDANKLTEGKRKAFQLINISPAFFLLQELMNTMFQERNKWEPVCQSLSNGKPMHGTQQFFAPLQINVRTEALLNHCAGMRRDLELENFNETSFLIKSSGQDSCRVYAMYLYVYRHLCTLPKDFLNTARLADQIIDDAGKLMTDRLYLDFTMNSNYRIPTVTNNQVSGTTVVQPTLPKIQDLYVSLQTFAFKYVDIMESALDAATKQSRVETISQELMKKAALCDSLYCTYLCKDYAYDIATKYCDVYEEIVDVIRSKYLEFCKVSNGDGTVTDFSYTAEITPVKLREADIPELKYCKASLRSIGRNSREICLFNAMTATANAFYFNYNSGEPPQNYARQTPTIFGSYRNGVQITSESLTTELEYFYAKFGACTGTVCSRAAGCDIQYSDLVAVQPYFKHRANWLTDFFFTYNSAWKRIMTPQPKMAFVHGTDNAFWFKSLNSLTNSWSDWASLGGSFKAPTAAVATNDGGVMLIGWYNDDTLRYRLFANNQWNNNGWISLGGSLTTKPSIISIKNYIFVFIVSGGQLLYKQFDGTNWSSSFISLGGSVTNIPTAVTLGDSSLLVFIKQGDSSVAYRKWNFATNSFENWVGLGGNIIGEVSTVMLGDARLFSFVKGSDNAVWYNIYENRAWFSNSWQSLGGVKTSNPVAVAFGDPVDKVFVFARGTDNALWCRLYQNSAWSEWQYLGGTLGSAPSPVAWDPNRVAVFARFSDYKLYYKLYKNGQWGNWIVLEGGTIGEPVSVALK